MKKRSNSSGFTLIEVLLVSMLLFMLAYATFSSVRSTMYIKNLIEYRSEALQSGRSLIELIDRDIRMAVYIKGEDLGWKPRTKKLIGDETPLLDADGNPIPSATATENTDLSPEERQALPEANPSQPVPLTIFQGNDKELLFSTRSHQRSSANVTENDLNYVRYRVEGTKLIREESVRLVNREDITNDKQFREFTILENLQKFQLKYWNPKADKWTDSWDSNSADTLDQIPDAVQVELWYKPDPSSDEAVPERFKETIQLRTTVSLTLAILRKGLGAVGGSSTNTPATVLNPGGTQ